VRQRSFPDAVSKEYPAKEAEAFPVGELCRLFCCKVKQGRLLRVRGYETLAFGSTHQPVQLGKLMFEPGYLGF
jgi:hypothetical protein